MAQLGAVWRAMFLPGHNVLVVCFFCFVEVEWWMVIVPRFLIFVPVVERVRLGCVVGCVVGGAITCKSRPAVVTCAGFWRGRAGVAE